MAKYRLLTLEELQELQKEFIEYLVVNGITAEDWEKLKIENVENAERIVELFSDVVFETIFRKVQYMDHKTEKEIISFQCLDDKIVMVGMRADKSSNVDFTNPEFIQANMNRPTSEFEIYTSEKPYSKQREIELFEMNIAGCAISDGKLFKSICMGFTT